MKADPSWTYLQCGFSPDNCEEQFHLLRTRYGHDFLFHIEFMKNGDNVVIPGAIPIVRFTTEERLNDISAIAAPSAYSLPIRTSTISRTPAAFAPTTFSCAPNKNTIRAACSIPAK